MPKEPVDLRTLFRALGGSIGVRALESTPTERTVAEGEVELLDTKPVKITAKPLAIEAFIDGIQASLCLTHRAHRPIYLSYIAAAALGASTTPKGFSEKLFIQTSALDVAFVEGLGAHVDLSINPSDDPPTLERDAQRNVGMARDQLERHLVTDLLTSTDGRLVLDGSLLAREHDARLVGVIKTTNHQWMTDESSLFGLPEGWRSPRFAITERSGRKRYSTYVQLVDKTNSAWNYGLIRLETFDPDLLDPLAALTLRERQGPRSGDPRGDRHLTSIHVVEEFLRARRPIVFARH